MTVDSLGSLKRLPIYAALLVLAIVFASPLLIVLSTSLKSMAEIRAGSLFALPHSPTFAAWGKAWSTACTGLDCTGMRFGFVNSVKIAVPSALLAVMVGAVNGFALAHGRIKGARLIVLLMLLGAFVPYQVILYPLVKIFSALGLFETLPGIIIIHVIFGIPICTLLFRNYYAALPPEIMRAARVDGAGFWRTFGEVVLPLSKNMIMVGLILQLTGIWNDYLIGLIFAGSGNLPMTVQLNNIINTGTGTVEYNVSMAATIITALPPLLVYFLSGRYFVRGIAAGAVKG